MKKRGVRNYPQIVDEINENIILQFQPNLKAVILYGSSQRGKVFWDLDILVILNKKNNVQEDLLSLKRIADLFKEQTLDLQLLYLKELSSAETFSLDAHGAFFSLILKKATVIYGENPFLNFQPSDTCITISLINRIQRYIFQARHEYLLNRGDKKDVNPTYHQKRIWKIILDLLLILEAEISHENLKLAFEKKFPNLFSEKDWAILNSDSDDIVEYIGLYEKIYDLSIAYSHLFVPTFFMKPTRGSIHGMVFECIIPDSYKEAVILIDGLPRVPELTQTMNLIASWGYAVFFPRLKGTWESEGEFLDHDPSRDIIDLARNITQGLKVGEETVAIPIVRAIGVSFGGLVGLSAALDSNIKSCVAISPVYALENVVGIETLNSFLKKTFPGAYRYSEEHWQDLVEGKILSLEKIAGDNNFDPSSCSIIAGIHDNQVNHDALASICRRLGIELHSLPLGHLALHKNIRTVLPILYNLLKK